jgi:ketosteroid isomerase-like protein
VPEPTRQPAAVSDPSSPAAVFERLVHGVCERRWAELPGLYAESTHVVHPQDPLRGAPLLTRDDLRRHFQGGEETLGEVRFTPAAITIHQTADPEVIVGEFEYRGTRPGTGEPFAIPNVFVMRVRDGQIVESRDYADHVELARVLGRLDGLADAVARHRGAAEGSRDAAAQPEPAPEAGTGWQDRAQRRYEAAVFGGDTAAPAAADQELDAVEADLALARGRIMHARFLADRQRDAAELACFERAAELYAAAGNAAGEAEALFWTAIFHQVIDDDNAAARPLLDRAAELAAAASDRLTMSYVVRHQAFADEADGELDLAEKGFAESLRLRREIGFGAGVAAALLALAEVTRRRGDAQRADALLAEAEQTARSDAPGILRWIEAARTEAS